jgi:hypothetical protein
VRVNTLRADPEEVARQLQAEVDRQDACGSGAGPVGLGAAGAGGGGGGGTQGRRRRLVGRVDGAPMALMLPASGPHAIDYSVCGEPCMATTSNDEARRHLISRESCAES